MRAVQVAAAAALSLLALSSAGHASTLLYYGGDLDPTNQNANALANEVDGVGPSAATYDNFTVSGSSWTVTDLFTNDLTDLTITSANWAILSGVSEGNGGTVVQSGTATPTVTATGRSDFGYTEYSVDVAVNFVLAPGTYWLSVQPVSADSSRSFNSNTFGLNAVGTHTADLDYFDSAYFGANFTNADNEGVFPGFSAGVYGSTGVPTPEPASMAVLLMGLAGLGFTLRRGRKGA